MKKILVGVFLSFFTFYSIASEKTFLTESEVKKCFDLGSKITSLEKYLKRDLNKLEEAIRKANSAEKKLDNLEYNLNLSLNGYNICASHGWECSASYNTYYYNLNRYNKYVDKSNRIYDKEDDLIRKVNRQKRSGKRLMKQYAYCEGAKIKYMDLIKFCDKTSGNVFCKGWKYD